MFQGTRLENLDAPYYSTPQAEAFWKPVFEGIRSRLAQRGWKETELLLGVPWDSWPQEEAGEGLKKITGGLRWRVFTHGFSYPLPDAQGRLNMPCGAEVGWLEVTGPIGVRDMAAKYPSLNKGALMKRTYPMTTVCRNQATMTSPMWIWRDAAPSGIRAGLQGFSQIGMDFWPVELPGRGRDDLIPPRPATRSASRACWCGCRRRSR